jgi:hypothetical protein
MAFDLLSLPLPLLVIKGRIQSLSARLGGDRGRKETPEGGIFFG